MCHQMAEQGQYDTTWNIFSTYDGCSKVLIKVLKITQLNASVQSFSECNSDVSSTNSFYS